MADHPSPVGGGVGGGGTHVFTAEDAEDTEGEEPRKDAKGTRQAKPCRFLRPSRLDPLRHSSTPLPRQ